MRFSRAAGIIILLLALFPAARAFAQDYFTELEIDEIRGAQEIDKRVAILLQIAEVRLAHLGLVELEEEVQSTSGNSRITRAIVRILSRETADELDRAEEELEVFDSDLSEFNRTELLEGYFQALEETMDNIDDAYEQKRGDLREPLELLRNFTEESIPLLREFEVENESEEIALEDAIGQAELALEGAEAAIETIPKTERVQ